MCPSPTLCAITGCCQKDFYFLGVSKYKEASREMLIGIDKFVKPGGSFHNHAPTVLSHQSANRERSSKSTDQSVFDTKDPAERWQQHELVNITSNLSI